IGYCIQNVGLFPHYSVRDNISIVPKLLKWTKEDIDARVDFLMDLTGLPRSYRDKKPHELSGGESQRVGVCRALAADPKILLMDEPFGAVDPMTRIKIQLAFRNIQKELKKTVVFVTHDVEEAILLADRIAVMQHGKILGYDTPEAFSHAMEVDFVQSFLGADYPVKLLKRHRLDEMVPQEADNSQVTLNEILAQLLQSPDGMITIQDIDGKDKQIRFEDLSRFLKGTDQP
ncbi:MAG: ATP-binding cassette domain-containing protein, partial [Erysipelotrichales bacterium]